MTIFILIALLAIAVDLLGILAFIIVGLIVLPILLGVSGFIITMLLLILYTLSG